MIVYERNIYNLKIILINLKKEWFVSKKPIKSLTKQTWNIKIAK